MNSVDPIACLYFAEDAKQGVGCERERHTCSRSSISPLRARKSGLLAGEPGSYRQRLEIRCRKPGREFWASGLIFIEMKFLSAASLSDSLRTDPEVSISELEGPERI